MTSQSTSYIKENRLNIFSYFFHSFCQKQSYYSEGKVLFLLNDRRVANDRFMGEAGHRITGYRHYSIRTAASTEAIFAFISRVENEKGLCAYIIYMHIAPFHSQPSIYVAIGMHDEKKLFSLNNISFQK